MKLVPDTGAVEIDRRTQDEYGIPGVILMENAGIRLFEALESEFRPEKTDSLIILAGGGNNGGDALVMARQAAAAGYSSITIITFKDEYSGLAGQWLAVCKKLGLEQISFARNREKAEDAIRSADILIDGLSGTGLKGELSRLPGECASFVANLSEKSFRTAAVDVPSGIGDSFKPGFTVLPADLTLTVAPGKLALYHPAAREFCGKIRHIPIGFPEGLVDETPGWTLWDRDEVREVLKPFAATAYKKTRGHAALFAGSKGTLGAALLAAEACARSGAGLVTLFLDDDIYSSAAGQIPPVIMRPVALNSSVDLPDLRGYASVLVGPGWGLDGRGNLLPDIVSSFKRGVIDADGLTLLSQLAESSLQLNPDWILTPHPGECARLLNCSNSDITDDPFGAAAAASEKYNATVLLKGHVSCVVSPGGRSAVIDGMNPLTGTGGSGDVLAGLTAGLMAAGDLDGFACAGTAAWIHQQAAAQAAEEFGVFTASDLLLVIGRITGEFRREGA